MKDVFDFHLSNGCHDGMLTVDCGKDLLTDQSEIVIYSCNLGSLSLKVNIVGRS